MLFLSHDLIAVIMILTAKLYKPTSMRTNVSWRVMNCIGVSMPKYLLLKEAPHIYKFEIFDVKP